MEIHHNIDYFILFIVLITLTSIICFLAVSIPAYEQQKIVNASPTIGVILIILTGVLLAIYGYIELKNENEAHGIVSSIA